MVIVLLVSLYTSRVFLNVLGVVDYGISNVVAGFVSMFSFFNISLSNGIQRFYNSEMGRNGEASITQVFNTALIIQCSIAAIVFILLETIGMWYIYEKLVIPPERFNAAIALFQFSVISAILVILQTPFSAAIMAYERMDYYAIVNILDVIAKLGFALLIPYVPSDRLVVYGSFYVVVAIANFLLYFLYCKKHFCYLYIQLKFRREIFINMISFSGWNLFGTFACMVREQGLNLVLNLFFGPVVNAARGIAYQVSSALQGFVTNLSLAAKPQMIQSYAEGSATRTIKLMNIMSKLSFVFLYMLAIPIILNVDYVLKLWLGDVVPQHTANFVILVLLIHFLNNLNAPLSNAVYATGKMRNYQVTFSILNILIIPIAYFTLLNGAPAETAFVVYFIMTFFVQFACLLVLKTLIEFSLLNYLIDIIIPIIIVACTSFPIIYCINLIMTPGIIRVLVVSFVTVIITSSSYFIFAMNKKEREFTKSTIKKIILKQICHA